MEELKGMLPFLVLGALGLANLVAAVGALRGARRAEELGEGRFKLPRDQHDRLELLRGTSSSVSVGNGWRRNEGQTARAGAPAPGA